MRRKVSKIQTNIKEIYMKLPTLNYVDEVIFSSSVPRRALKKIVDKFNKDGFDVELLEFENRFIIIKKGDLNFNTYLINSL